MVPPELPRKRSGSQGAGAWLCTTGAPDGPSIFSRTATASAKPPGAVRTSSSRTVDDSGPRLTRTSPRRPQASCAPIHRDHLDHELRPDDAGRARLLAKHEAD